MSLDAVDATPPFLSKFRVRSFSTQFRRDGLRYSRLNEAQRAELEDQDAAAAQVEYDAKDLDKIVFNRDTNRFIRRTLMDEGIREATGAHVGKTIVFARGRPSG